MGFLLCEKEDRVETLRGFPASLNLIPLRSMTNNDSADLPGDQARSKRSRSITLAQAATKSWTNFFAPSELP